MPVFATSAWDARETYGTYGTSLPVCGGRRSKFAFWDAIGMATRSVLFRDDLTYERHLGEGSQFVVDLYRYEPKKWSKQENMPELIAVKTAKVRSPDAGGSIFDRHDLYHFTHEIQILQYGPVMSHPNIVQLVSSTWKEGHTETPVPQLMVEYTPLGNLSEYLQQTSPVGIIDKLKVMRDMSFALEFLHRSGIIHGDVKLPNVMAFPGEGGSSIVAKLSDFGCAITAMDDEETRFYRGTRDYFPPDMKEGCVSSMEILMKCEVFVFGLSIWEILQDGKPYYENAKRIHAGEKDTSLLLVSFDEVIMSPDVAFRRTQSKKEHNKNIVEPAIDDSILTSLQRVVHSILKSSCNTRPTMQEVASILEECFQLTFRGITSIKETTVPLGAKSDFWAGSCIWKFTDAQHDLPYRLQSQSVRALEALLPSLPKDDLAYAFLLLSYSAAHGYGVPVDALSSFEYLKKAAETGFKPARFLLIRMLPAFVECMAPGVDHSVLSTANSSITPSPEVFHVEVRLEPLSQQNKFNLWWRELNELGLQNQLSSELTLLTRNGSYQLPSPADPKAISQFVESHAIDMTDSLIQIREQCGRTPPPIHVLHFFASHGWLGPFEEIRRQGVALCTNTSRPEWYSGLLEPITNIALSAALNGRCDMVLYMLNNAIPPSNVESSGDGTWDLQNMINGLHLLGMFDDNSIKEVADCFVRKGADPNMSSNLQRTWTPLVLEGFPLLLGGGPPLDTAVWLRSITAVKTLLALGADPLLLTGPEEIRHLRHSSLHLAVSLHQYEIVELMLTHLASRKYELANSKYAEDLLLWISGELVGGKDLWRRWVTHGSEWRHALKRTIQLCIEHGANLSCLRYDGARPLVLACQKHPCQLYIVEALLEAGCDPNERAGNDEGALPIHTCIWDNWGDAEAGSVLEVLVKYKANLDLCALINGESCAHVVASNNWTKSLLFLKESGANLNIQDKQDRTPLFAAVLSGATDSVRLLLELGVEVNITDSNGETALHLAIEEGEVECVKLLLGHGASVESITECYKGNGLKQMNALELAAYWGRISVLEIIQEHIQELGYEPGDRDSVLSVAVKGSKLEALKFLLRDKTRHFQDFLVKPDKAENSLLVSAVLDTNEPVRREIIHELLRAGMHIDFRVVGDPGDMTRTALAASIEKGDIETVRMLLGLGATPYCRGCPEDKTWSFLHEAALHARRPTNTLKEQFDDFLRACQSWIDEYDPLSFRDFNGRTALHTAIYCGQAGVAKSLIAAGCSIYDKVAKMSTTDTFFDISGLNALELAYELATFPARKRHSHHIDIKGVPDENVLAVIKLLKTFRAPEDRRRSRERLSWRLRKWWRHSNVKREELVGNVRKRLAKKDN